MTEIESSEIRPVHDDYRAAISLNNMGVSLLERSVYREALDMLKDAVCVMKHVCQPRCNCCPSTANGKIDRLFVTSTQNHCDLLRKSFVGDDTSSFQVRAILDNDIASRTRRILEQGQGQEAWPIRIDCADLSRGDSGRDVDIDSVILLYNLGTAHFCLARESKDDGMYNGALRLFTLAHRILLQKGRQYANQQDCIQQEQPLFLFYMVLRMIHQILILQDRQLEANETRQRLVVVYTALRQIEGSDKGNDAAAAA